MSFENTKNGLFEIFPEGKYFRYRLKSNDNEVLAVSELYTTQRGVFTAIESVRRNVEVGKFVVFDDKHNNHKFKLIANNSRIVIVGANYTCKEDAESSLEKFKKFALIADTEILKDGLIDEKESDLMEVPYEKVILRNDGKYVLCEEDAFTWFLKTHEGVIIASGRDYSTKQGCLNGIDTFKTAVEHGEFLIAKDKNNLFKYRLYSKSGRIIVIGESYETKEETENSVNLVRALYMSCICELSSNGKEETIEDDFLEEQDELRVEDLTVEELYNVCETNKITTSSKMTKEDLVKSLKAKGINTALVTRRYDGKFEVFPEGNYFRYRLKANNGEILVVSELYTTEQGCLNAIETVRRNVEVGTFTIFDDKHDNHKFKLVAGNHRILVVGANYSTKQGATNAQESFKRFSQSATIVVLLKPLVDEKESHLMEVPYEKVELINGGKYVLCEEDAYTWSLQTNKDVVIASARDYASPQGCLNGIDTFKTAVEKGEFLISKDKFDRYKYRLYTKAGRMVLIGESYETIEEAQHSVNLVRGYYLSNICQLGKDGKEETCQNDYLEEVEEVNVEELTFMEAYEAAETNNIAVTPVMTRYQIIDLLQKNGIKKAKVTRRYDGKFEVFPESKYFRYRLKANNGEILVVSELYMTQQSCLNAIETVKRNVEYGTFTIFDDKHDNHKFKLVAGNHRILVVGANYSTKQSATNAQESFKRFSQTATIVVLKNPLVDEKESHLMEVALEKVSPRNDGKYELCEEDAYTWSLKTNEGTIIASARDYSSPQGCLNGIDTFKIAIEEGEFLISKDKNNLFKYKLYTKSGRMVLIGESYKTKEDAENSVHLVRTYYKDSPIEEVK